MRTAEHLPSGWPFESSHYHSTFRTPQLAYCRHNVQPYSVHRKNNPHAAILDPWKYPDKVTFPHICGRGGMGGWQPCSQGLSSSRTFSLEGVTRREREREPRGEFGPLGLRDINIFLLMFLTELLGVEGQSIFESPACSGIAVGTEHSPT